VPTRAETDHRPTRAALRTPPPPPSKRMTRVYLRQPASSLAVAADQLPSLQALPQTLCKAAPFAQRFRPNRPPSTRPRRFPLDIRRENAIACLRTFIPNTNATVRRSVQRTPEDVRDTRSTAVGEDMRPAAPGVTEASTSTFSMGTDPGAQAPSSLSHHPYGLCTPRRSSTSFVFCAVRLSMHTSKANGASLPSGRGCPPSRVHARGNR
jgi:hypothetical protein